MQLFLALIRSVFVALAGLLVIAFIVMSFAAVSGSKRRTEANEVSTEAYVPNPTNISQQAPSADAPPRSAPIGVASAEMSLASSLLTADPRTVVILPSRELGAHTLKWRDKIVETKAYCSYAGHEYDCIIGGARVQFSSIEPPEARTEVERRCDNLQKAQDSFCMVTIRFILAGFQASETGGMTLLKARDGRGALISPRAKH